MINNSSTLSSWWNNFNNGDEALFNDASLPRDSYGFKIQPWMQSDKLDYWTQVKDFYLDQITAVWGKEIAGMSWELKNTVIPLKWLDNLPFSTYWVSQSDVDKKGKTYTKWSLAWKVNDKWGIVIPAPWSYMINFYAEVYFDPAIWQTSFLVSLLDKNNDVYYTDAKVASINPDVAWSITLQDLKQWDELYLGWSHASASGKKALYIWTVTIFKLS